MRAKQTLILIILFLFTNMQADEPTPYIMAHFMPWNVAPPIASNWGYHWTMNHFNPENTDADGKHEIASHYYPLTGPYDSMDPDIMEYQVLLMKLSGIDGIIVDWYGSSDLWDYPYINDRTLAMFEYIEKAGLKFCICYEDQTIPNLINQNRIDEQDKLEQGQEDIQYLEDTWFSKEAHLKLDGQPVLLNFGPQFFKNSSDWETIFSVLSSPPLFFTEDNRLSPAAAGAFPWPPMWKAASDGELSISSLRQYLNDFSTKSKNWPYRMSSAFPGFNDIYKEANVSNGYAFLDADSGSTFEMTLEKTLENDPHIIQLVTWNDYGEGTIIEPTQEFGYRYLEIAQQFRRENIDSTFLPNPYHLRLPMEIYELRREHPNDTALNAKLDEAFDLIVSMQPDSAESLLDAITAVENSSQPVRFELLQNYPNPFNAQTTIAYEVITATDVKLSIYNNVGQRVATLVNGWQTSGRHQVIWDAAEFSTGVYFYRIESGNKRLVKKCLLVK